MASKQIIIALLREIFVGPDAGERLKGRLIEAKEMDADLVVLPELPYNAWSPATTRAVEADAEEPGGWREAMQNQAAATARVSVLGGVIQRVNSVRHNMAIFSDQTGSTVARYAKVHLPDEEGFRECHHYDPGKDWPRTFEALETRFGIQICSDANRLVGSHLLAAQGVQVILAPRASSEDSWDRWLLVFRAIAQTCAAWVISVGRPGPENGVPIGGPAVVIDPMGVVVKESLDALSICSLDPEATASARKDYPGYLAWPAEVYAEGWRSLHSNSGCP